MTGRGWSSAGLRVVGDDENLWTVADAARLLGPPVLTEAQVRQLIRLIGIQPMGKRNTSQPGRSARHARVYHSLDLIRAFDAIHRLSEDLP